MKDTENKWVGDGRSAKKVFISILILIVAGALGLVGYRLYENLNSAQAAFNEVIDLKVGQKAVLSDGADVIKFRFTELEPVQHPNPGCGGELCRHMLPTIMTELEYAGRTLMGTTTSDTGIIDMSFEQNGAYPLVPYRVEMVGIDFDRYIGTARIVPKQFTEIKLGEEFTVEDDGVAALVPGRSGVHVAFGVCGDSLPCLRTVDFYMDDEYVPTSSLRLTNPVDSLSGVVAEHDGIRLYLVKSDSKTYATFVLEEI